MYSIEVTFMYNSMYKTKTGSFLSRSSLTYVIFFKCHLIPLFTVFISNQTNDYIVQTFFTINVGIYIISQALNIYLTMTH